MKKKPVLPGLFRVSDSVMTQCHESVPSAGGPPARREVILPPLASCCTPAHVNNFIILPFLIPRRMLTIVVAMGAPTPQVQLAITQGRGCWRLLTQLRYITKGRKRPDAGEGQ